MAADPAAQRAEFARLAAANRPPSARVALLGLVLVAAVYVAGSPELNAPWIQGDEFVFIVDDADINPGSATESASTGLITRLEHICTRVHDDLYQPIPMLSYAIEWSLSRGDPLSFRRTDLLLHALNGLLLWAALHALLRRVTSPAQLPLSLLAWSLALIWALHPMHVAAYAADMGRTHLLSATFTLVALLLHLRALTSGRGAYFGGALVALLLAMLCKPIPGWILPAFVLEAMCRGWQRTLRSIRVYLIAVVCVVFAVLTLWSTAREGLLEDAARGLFGDPLARSGLAIWIYFRNLFAPLRLSYWQLPDPRTGWSDPLVWAGLVLALASFLHAGLAWRRPETHAATFGWAWCWGLLLPVIGLVGAREAAASDRYFYQPLMGIMVVLGVVLVRGLQRVPAMAAARATRWVVLAATGLGLLLLLWCLPHCAITRSNVRRAERLVELNAGDPRALEALAAAYDFAQNHPLPGADMERVPQGTTPAEYYRRLWHDTLMRAADEPNLAYFFPGPGDRGPFHRRMSYRFLRAGDPQRSLEQAQAAERLLPDEYRTWVRLAHAYQALQRYDEAAGAYEHAERLLPADPETRAVHFTNYANLLMFDLDRDDDACVRFDKALETGRAPMSAKLGLAACQIRHGDGALGYRLVSEVLRADPTNEQAGLILGEYHLLSHHWEQALKVYEALLRDDPTSYAALRGLQEVCLQTAQRDAAVRAWSNALRQAPERREFRSFQVWSLALAGSNTAADAAQQLLATDADNPLACLALMLEAVRGGRLDEALQWIDRARAGQPVPKAREFARAASALQRLLGAKELPPEASVAQAAVYLKGGFPSAQRDEAHSLLDRYLATSPDPRWIGVARQLSAELSDHAPNR